MACRGCGGKGYKQTTKQKIKSLYIAAKDVIKGEYVGNLLRIKRLNICQSCDAYSNGICKVCGCVMRLKVKLKNQSCPGHETEGVKW